MGEKPVRKRTDLGRREKRGILGVWEATKFKGRSLPRRRRKQDHVPGSSVRGGHSSLEVQSSSWLGRLWVTKVDDPGVPSNPMYPTSMTSGRMHAAYRLNQGDSQFQQFGYSLNQS